MAEEDWDHDTKTVIKGKIRLGVILGNPSSKSIKDEHTEDNYDKFSMLTETDSGYTLAKMRLAKLVKEKSEMFAKPNFLRLGVSTRENWLNDARSEFIDITVKLGLFGYQAEQLQRYFNHQLEEVYDQVVELPLSIERHRERFEGYIHEARDYLKNGFKKLTPTGKKRRLTQLINQFPGIDPRRKESQELISLREVSLRNLKSLCSKYSTN